MALRVLIIEDQSDLRSFLHARLHEAFRKKARHGWPAGWPEDAKKYLQIDVLSDDELGALRKLKRVQAVKKRLEERDEPPHVIITDLALSTSEVKKLDKAGGTEPTGAKDPRKQLEHTTGFQILKAMASTVPVIATSYASNPLVIEACWKAGAHAVIPKPTSDKRMEAYYGYWKLSRNPEAKLVKYQTDLAKKWGRKIEVYFQAATHEVLKAVQARALTRMESVAPRRLPYWLALNHDRLEVTQIAGTSLMLLEIEGFSELATLGKSKPKALFRMMNEIWDQVQPCLVNSGAEINHFGGDAALVFHGVYEEDTPGCLEDTLRCGAEISRLFEIRGPVRARLAEVIAESYSTAPDRVITGLKRHVEGASGNTFNVRVISIEPPEEDALYGCLGASSRWQHSTLSRYVNLLRAGKEVLDEAQRTYSQENGFRRGGESFLITNRLEPPAVVGFTTESLKDILEKDPPEHPELLELEIHRVFKLPDREPVG